MYLSEKPKVVCKFCQHHIFHEQVDDFDECCFTSYDGCTAQGPTVTWCPVTGREQTNWSLCRVVNQDGKCKHFEVKRK